MNRRVVIGAALALCVFCSLAFAAQKSSGAVTGRLGVGYDPNALLNPKSPAANRKAPEKFQAKFVTSKGEFTVEVVRAWAPQGADRFYNLVRNGFFNDARFFRVLTGFVAQFGINGNPKVAAAWKNATIPDDPVKESNKRGTLVFATAGPNTRTTQLFINLVDNARLDQMGFSPFGSVVQGMEVVDQFYAGYGDGAPRGNGPEQGRIEAQGNAYLNASFPNLDYIKTATIVKTAMSGGGALGGGVHRPAPARKPAPKQP
jgi:peptidyl-prolyl cis-trans isomerase A (cyclophilin A)